MLTDLSLPDPLLMNDGTPVTNPELWARRRDEILQLFEQNMYGRMPSSDGGMAITDVETASLQIDGVDAVRKQFTIKFNAGRDTDDGPFIDVLQYCPVSAKPCGVFVGLNFKGNHTVTADPAVRLSRSVARAARLCGINQPPATDAERGSMSSRWPISTILKSGFGVMTAHYEDIEPDHSAARAAGVRPLFDSDSPAPDWGAIAAWAWGLRRMCDALQNDAAIDPAQIAIIGHSRLGKAALWAGALDERFSLVISNESGCGGTAIKRRKVGERYRDITTRFPHWFSPALSAYNDREEECPVDQHLLLACVAPRLLYVASATNDLWADPEGEFLGAWHAGPVYKLLGQLPLVVTQPPPPNTPVGHAIGYHVREGSHEIEMTDWQYFLQFAQKHFHMSQGD